MTETLQRYHQFCDSGHDGDFSKNPKFLRPVRKGPFYAMRVFNAGYTAFGGVKINGHCEVLDEQGMPIRGLYGAGDCACGEVWEIRRSEESDNLILRLLSDLQAEKMQLLIFRNEGRLHETEH